MLQQILLEKYSEFKIKNIIKHKKFMNKKILGSVLFLLGTLLMVVSVLPSTALAANDLVTIVNTIGTQLTLLAAGLAIISFLVSGIMFVSAAGSPEMIGKAKKALIYGVIGVVVMLLAKGAQAFVVTFTGLTP